MKKFGLLIFILSSFALAQNAWINEFHYDNSVADLNEFVEVIIPNSLTTSVELAKFSVVL